MKKQDFQESGPNQMSFAFKSGLGPRISWPFFVVSRPTPAEANPRNSHQSSSYLGLVRVRSTLGQCLAYDAVRSERKKCC